MWEERGRKRGRIGRIRKKGTKEKKLKNEWKMRSSVERK